MNRSGMDRREFLAATSATSAAFVLGFWVPPRTANAQVPPTGASWYEDPSTPEINAWIVIAPDDTVTIRIAQTELGQLRSVMVQAPTWGATQSPPIVEDPVYLTGRFITSSHFRKEPDGSKWNPRPCEP